MTLIQKIQSKQPLISIYLSRGTLPHSEKSYPIRWVSLLKEARRQLQSELTEKEIDSLMAPLWRLEIDSVMTKGVMSIAVFHGHDGTHFLRLPLEIEDLCVVARSYHIKPVLYWIQSDPKFYLLALGSKQVKLYRGSSMGMECLRKFTPEMNHTESKRQNSRNPESNRDRKKIETIRFFQLVEQQIRPILSKDHYPVIVAGVKSLIPLYRKVNHDPDLVSEFIQGSPHHLSEKELQSKSGEILHKLFEIAKEKAISDFENAEPQGVATTDLPKIIEAASQGQVQKLLVAYNANLWGSFDSNPTHLRIHTQKISAREDDILDDLAELVLAKGGKVLTLPLSQMPHFEPAAAILK